MGRGILQILLPLISRWQQLQLRSLGIEKSRSNCFLIQGLAERKGRIAVGYDADFVVWNPEEMFTINTANIQHKNKITPYLGMQLSGVVHKVQCATQGILMTIPLYFSLVPKSIPEL
jgi:dihydroorotase-like cyclic amidohydrolase